MVTCRCCRSELSRPLSTAEVKLAWRRLICSFSFIFGVAQIATFLVILFTNPIEEFSQNPMLAPNYYVLDNWGAKNAARMKYSHEWWRLVSPMGLHAGWVHLLSNLMLQLRLSIVLEVLWGSPAWLVIYVSSGAFGSIASAIFMPNTLSVGSSGALCGLIGAWVPFILATWNQTLPRDVKLRNAQLTLVVSSILLLIPLGFMPMVDNAAHGGGLIAGMAVSSAIFAGRLQSRAWRIGIRILGILLVLLLFPASGYWFWFHVEPTKDLLELCPPPGCLVYVPREDVVAGNTTAPR